MKARVHVMLKHGVLDPQGKAIAHALGSLGFGAMKARVQVMLKHGVLDPQGRAIAHALGSLGFGGVNEVRQGKVIDLDLVEDDPNRARAAVESMCQQLLANTVIESYQIELKG